MSIRVLLADDHPIVLHGLIRAIQQEQDMEVVGQAHTGRSAVELATALRPDVVLMDINMPDLSGIEATGQLQKEAPEIRVIGLSMHSASRYAREMFEAGASGYLLKDGDFEELTRAIRTVAGGETYMSLGVSGVRRDDLIRPKKRVEPKDLAPLTQREREILQVVAGGRTTKQAAAQLGISPKTVESHRLRVMQKLGFDNIAQLTKYAIEEGLTSAQP